MGLLDIPVVRRVRRHHAVEHATIHLLTPKYHDIGLAGRADGRGFYLYGAVDTADVEWAAGQALLRLATEPALAVHPRCGTNLVVNGFVAGVTSLLAVASLGDHRRRNQVLDVLPRLMLAGTAAAIASQSLGPLVQERCTTLPDVEGLRLKSVQRSQHGRHVFHRVLLEETAG